MSDLYVIEGVDVDDADGRHWSRPIPREATIPEVVAWLREQGAIDYEAATNITRELTSHLPADFEGSYDATVWTLNIVDAALRVEEE